MSNVLILGAGSDIATALARKFAAEGFGIQLAARRVDRLEPLKSDIAIRYNTSCTLHEFDAEQVGTHLPFIDSLPSLPDITVTVFGYLGDQHKAESDWNECHRILQVNYVGAVSFLNLVAEKYSDLGRGAIVGISSVAGERGRQSNYLYGSAKAGFTAYLSGLRNRLSPKNVQVLTVKPGFVYTKMTEHLTLPAPLTATPEQVAAAISAAVRKNKNVIYVKWIWRWIMLAIRSIPEPIFKKMRL